MKLSEGNIFLSKLVGRRKIVGLKHVYHFCAGRSKPLRRRSMPPMFSFQVQMRSLKAKPTGTIGALVHVRVDRQFAKPVRRIHQRFSNFARGRRFPT